MRANLSNKVLENCLLSHIDINRERSPILQNGRIVGAVTHVLLNDPTRGYGIFIENMLDMAG